MRFDGTLKTWNDERAFCFIEPAQGGQQIFVHIKAFPRGCVPRPGQSLSFDLAVGPNGKKRAELVRLAAAASRPTRLGSHPQTQWGTATLFALPAFLVVCLAVAVLWRPPAWVAGLYAGGSIVAFIAYAADKAAAQRGGRRTPESTLHLLALAGGWPGALLAQQLLRHKSAKVEFRREFWVTVTLNLAAFVLVCWQLHQRR